VSLAPALAILLFALCTLPAAAQECRDDIPASTPAERFVLLRDGTLVDRHNGLRWQRCAVGQHWNGTGCSGEAAMLTRAGAAHHSGNGWRLPTLQELGSIVELRCRQPAIDLTLFPNAPAGNFWSATPFANLGDDGPRYWQVQFIYGESNLGGLSELAFVRLMKKAD